MAYLTSLHRCLSQECMVLLEQNYRQQLAHSPIDKTELVPKVFSIPRGYVGVIFEPHLPILLSALCFRYNRIITTDPPRLDLSIYIIVHVELICLWISLPYPAVRLTITSKNPYGNVQCIVHIYEDMLIQERNPALKNHLS